MVGPWAIFEPGGVSSVIANLGAALERSGHWQVHYLQLADADADTDSPQGHRVFHRRIRPVPPARSTLRTRLAFALALIPNVLRIRALLRRHRIAVINVHYPTPEAWLFAALRTWGLFKGKLVLSIHGLDIRETLRHAERARAMRPVYSAADAVVACSNSLARDVPRLAAPLAERTRTIYNGLDPAAATASRSIRQPKGTPVSGPVLLSVATFETKKGLDVLVRAFAICLGTHPSMRLRMIGQRRTGHATYEEIVQQVAALGIVDRVEFFTDLPNEHVMAAMAAADAFILPSRCEPFGLVLLEAGAIGTPIVATDVDGIPEVVPSADYGLLVPPDDPTALADAILSVFRDPAAAQHRADNMRRRVRQQFTWEIAATRYEALLEVLRR